MKNKKIVALLLGALAFSTFSSVQKTYALNEGFTATELSSSETIVVDGTKDSSWDNATSFDLNTVRFDKSTDANNQNPATGKVSVMYNSTKLYTKCLLSFVQKSRNFTLFYLF